MRIAVDALGGDHAPGEIVTGAIAAVRERGLELSLVGPENKLRVLLRQAGMSAAIEIVPALNWSEMVRQMPLLQRAAQVHLWPLGSSLLVASPMSRGPP